MAYKHAGIFLKNNFHVSGVLVEKFSMSTDNIKFWQRYGPPPSYPQLKIPGLNAPIPPGASFGYRPGEWGKPPVDEVYHMLDPPLVDSDLLKCSL